MIVRIANAFGTYLLRDPEVVTSALYGPCLRAEYRLPGDDHWQLAGDFRLDLITEAEEVSSWPRYAATERVAA